MLAPTALGIRVASDVLMARWDAYDRLSKDIQDRVTAPAIADRLFLLAKKFNLDERVILGLSHIVRKIFFGEISKESLEREVSLAFSSAGSMNTSIVPNVAREIVETVLSVRPNEGVSETKDLPVTEQLSLLQALGKYQNLGNQQITGSKIAIKGQNDPVRPTIFNWLKAYRDELGVGRHDAVVRGNFLFHSINGKGLSAEERERLGAILKSLDENVPVPVDAEKQQVVFREVRGEREEVRPARISSESVAGEGVTRPAFAALAHRSEAASSESRIRNQESGVSARPTDGRNQESRNERTIQNTNNTSRMTEPPKMSEQIELGKLAVVPGGSMVKEVPEAEPAPRRVSFEPAKIEKFEFGASSVSGGAASPVFSESVERFGEMENTEPLTTQNPKVAELFKQPAAPKPLSTPLPSNVGSVVFTTKHVLPAEKEAVLETKKVEEKPKAPPEVPLSKPAFDIPKIVPKQKPAVPAQPTYNPAYRIRPMSHLHKQEAEKNDLPPDVVNLKNER